MKLEDCRKAYYEYSGKASDICRNLGFAGLALIWAFRITAGEKPVIPCVLRWAGILLVSGLALDFLQYISSTLIWGIYHRYKEKNGISEQKEFLAPRWINYPSIICFVIKQVSIFIAYILLVISMFNAFWE
jgi:hypothetical protein